MGKIDLDWMFSDVEANMPTSLGGSYKETTNEYTIYTLSDYHDIYLSHDNKYVNIINPQAMEAEQYNCKPRTKSVEERAVELKNKWF